MTEDAKHSQSNAMQRPDGKRSRPLIAGIGAALLALGVAGGAIGAGLLRDHPASYDATLAPTPIAQTATASGEQIALDGKVAEIFGNKFVITDGTARVLVDTGPAGEKGGLIKVDEAIQVQGHFEEGFLHAHAIRRANGEVEELATPPPPGSKPHRH